MGKIAASFNGKLISKLQGEYEGRNEMICDNKIDVITEKSLLYSLN